MTTTAESDYSIEDDTGVYDNNVAAVKKKSDNTSTTPPSKVRDSVGSTKRWQRCLFLLIFLCPSSLRSPVHTIDDLRAFPHDIRSGQLQKSSKKHPETPSFACIATLCWTLSLGTYSFIMGETRLSTFQELHQRDVKEVLKGQQL